jgi:drug/metabolite transporter (DMT)-like permease
MRAWAASAMALTAIAFWSTNAVVAKHVLSALPFAQVQFLQFIGATICFGVLRLIAKPDTLRGGWDGHTIAAGVIGITGVMVFQYVAFRYGPIAETNLVAYSWPILLSGLFVLTGTVAYSFKLMLLTALGFLGTALIIQPVNNGFSWSGVSWGYLAAAMSAIMMAGYSWMVTRSTVDRFNAHLCGAILGAALLGLCCMTMDEPWRYSSYDQAMALYLGVGPIGLGYCFWAMALSSDTSGRIAILVFLTPVVSTFWLLLVGETMTTNAVVGSVLVVGCSIAINLPGGWLSYARR